MASQMTHRTTDNGNGTLTPEFFTRDYAPPRTWHSLAAQVCAALSALAGLWVAISPWFLTLQSPAVAGNARVDDLVVGLAVAAIGALGVSGYRGFFGLQTASLLLGCWVIVSPFILTAKYAITGSMYWSNSWAGAVIVVLAAASLAALRPAAELGSRTMVNRR